MRGRAKSTGTGGPFPAKLRDLFARADLLLLVVALPLLTFPVGNLPWAGLALGIAGWVLRRVRTGSWIVRSHLNFPILALFLMAFVSLYPSVDPALSMPKFFGMILGLLVFYSTLGNVETQRHFWFGLSVLVVSLAAVLTIGIVGTQWNAFKAPFFQPIYGYLPRMISSVQTSVGVMPAIHANEVGGTLAFLLPLPAALVIGAPLGRLQKVALGSLVTLAIGVLLLTYSRSALLALTAVILLLVLWRWRRAGIAILVAAAGVLSASLVLNAPGVVGLLLKMDVSTTTAGLGTFAYRTEIWERAGYMIHDYPFTGIGLNTFSVILDTLYPSLMGGLKTDLPHAHNIFLHTAVDLGLGGLAGFLALLASAAYVGWCAYRQAANGGTSARSIQAGIVGLLLGMLSYLVFGLTDAITLGAKPTALLWLMMGLLVSIYRATLVSGNDAWQLRGADPVGSAVGSSLRIAKNFYWYVTFGLVALGYVAIALAVPVATP